MKTTLLFLCAFLVPSTATAAALSREGELPSRREERMEAEIPRLLGPVDHMVEHAHASVVKGLEARTTSQSIADFHHAERTYADALRRIDQLARNHPRDPALIGALDALRGRAQNDAVGAAIDAGHVFLARADLQDALREADRAVSIAPDDTEALAFRDTTALPETSLIGVIPLRSRAAILGPAFEPRAMVRAMPMVPMIR